MIWAVIWTDTTHGHIREWHYGREDVANDVAAQLRNGIRKDAHVETR